VTANVHNITGSHQYVIEGKEVDGKWKAVLSCKQFAATSDDKWQEVGPLLKVNPTDYAFDQGVEVAGYGVHSGRVDCVA
jgi:hypothetical protein